MSMTTQQEQEWGYPVERRVCQNTLYWAMKEANEKPVYDHKPNRAERRRNSRGRGRKS